MAGKSRPYRSARRPAWLAALVVVLAWSAAGASPPPFTQQAYVKASNTDAHDGFGWAVAVSGDTMVIGAPFESSGGAGASGGQDDNGAVDAGAAYVFVRNGRTWQQQAYLKPLTPAAGDWFGMSVAIDGDTVVIGAPAGSLDGGPLQLRRGSAYVFVRSGTTWSQQVRLGPEPGLTGSTFGGSVAVSADTVVVAAAAEAPSGFGTVYVFTRVNTGWRRQARLTPPDPPSPGGFAAAVGLSADTLAVGAPRGTQVAPLGVVHLYVRSGGTWAPQAVVASPSAAADEFGGSLAIDGDSLVVGAPSDDSWARGVNGMHAPGAFLAGGAYVFVRTGTTWAMQAYLKASNTDPYDQFGVSVALSGDLAVVGAPTEESNAAGIEGVQDDNSLMFAGAAYVFSRTAGTWRQNGYLKASNPDAWDLFGAAVAVSRGTVAVGAPGEGGSVRRVNGAPNDRAGFSGAAYVLVPPADDDGDGLPDDWEVTFGLDPTTAAAANGASGDPDGDGLTNAQELAAASHPLGRVQCYLAEGATSTFFDTRLALLNPGATDTTATLTFSRADNVNVVYTVPVPAQSRVTVDPGDVPGMAVAEFSTKVETEQPIVVDRTLAWDRTNRYGAHTETAVAAPALTWYVAEGATHSGFSLFYLLQNPNAEAADVRVQFLRPSGSPLEKTYTLLPRSRTNIWVNYEDFGLDGLALAATDVSAVFYVLNAQPIIVERALYLDRPGLDFSAGHESAGVTAPALDWFLAEGMTGAYFDLFVLIANPGSADAQVEATYLLPDGTTVVVPHTVAAHSRFNIWVDLEDPRLADTPVSTTIHATNGVPVIVERALWWPWTFATWYEAHNSPGATATGTRWALADGEVGGSSGSETYILVANTSAQAGDVRVTLHFEDGRSATRTFAVTGRSRFNVDVAAEYPAAANQRFGATVESLGASPAQIVVERATYWNSAAQPWGAGTNALATKLQ